MYIRASYLHVVGYGIQMYVHVQCIYATWDHSLVISGHPCLRQGEPTPPALGVQQQDYNIMVANYGQEQSLHWELCILLYSGFGVHL